MQSERDLFGEPTARPRLSKEEQLARRREKYATNPHKEERLARRREKYATNPDRIKEAAKQYYLANSTQVLERMKTKYWEDPAKSRQAKRQCVNASPEIYRAIEKKSHSKHRQRRNDGRKARYWKNFEKARQARVSFYWAAPERSRKLARDWRKKNPYQFLQSRYGIAIHDIRPRPDYCELSGELANDLVFDHDHNTGMFRGWVRRNYNAALGAFNHDPRLLRLAADYLERHRRVIDESTTDRTNGSDRTIAAQAPSR